MTTVVRGLAVCFAVLALAACATANATNARTRKNEALAKRDTQMLLGRVRVPPAVGRLRTQRGDRTGRITRTPAAPGGCICLSVKSSRGRTRTGRQARRGAAPA